MGVDNRVSDRFVGWLKNCLGQFDSDAARMQCLEGLADMQDIPNIEIVERLLLKTLREDSNSVVRHEAAFVLGRLHKNRQSISEKIILALFQSARTDRSIIVRHEATEVLGKLKDSRIPLMLSELAKDSNVDVATTAKLGLEYQTLQC